MTVAELMDWKPIDTAPKDGTRIILFSPRDGQYTGLWAPDGVWRLGNSPYDDCILAPTHWMPLPNAPSK